MQITIRPLHETDMPAASKLIGRVFDQFEAPGYPAEGLVTFRRYTAPEELAARLERSEMAAWGAFYSQRLVGILATRSVSHISLLFVDAQHHRQGIARALFGQLRDALSSDPAIRSITVNSSAYASTIYPRLGFSPTGPERTTDGIRYTPMEFPIGREN